MGLLDILRGVADQADFIPGVDPNKDSRGLISQLLGMNKQPLNPSGVPPIVPQNAVQKPSVQAPGGAAPNPFQQFSKQRGPFARMLTPNSYDRQHDAGHQNFLTHQANQLSAQQAQQAAAQANKQFTQNAQAGGFDPAEIARMSIARNANPEEFGKSFAGNFGFNSASEGSVYSQFGRTPTKVEKTELTTDAVGRPIIANLDAQTFSDPQGPAKPVNLASGAQSVDPITNQVLASNTGMTDYQAAQIANEQAEIAASANETDVSGESALRKEFLSQNKGFQEVQRAYDRIVSTDPTNAAGQMSLIFQYMKMMDPGSTVREGEFANAQNTTGIPGQVLNAYNRAARGEYLNPTQVSEFQTQAASLYGAAANDFERSFQQYRSTASQYEYDQGRTIPDLRNPEYMEDQIATITSDEQFDALPSGAIYQGPDGVKRRKP